MERGPPAHARRALEEAQAAGIASAAEQVSLCSFVTVDSERLFAYLLLGGIRDPGDLAVCVRISLRVN